MNHLKGWISAPILLLVMMLAWLLITQSQQVQQEKMWQTQYQANSYQAFWHEVEAVLLDGSIVTQPSPCTGFCAPWNSDWSSEVVEGKAVYVQRHRAVSINADRWCASLDRQEIHCWWRREGQLAKAVLRR